MFLHFELAIVVGIATCDYATLLAISLARVVDIAVRRDRDMTGGAETIGDHQGAEPFGKGDAAVIGFAGWRGT
jgi:hypothetical protein